MIRDILKIDDELCTGCGDCIPGCHEGALQIIDGKVRLISELMCDGLGACIGSCPTGAITIEKREAEPYNETRVMELMIDKGPNTIIAHLKHLKDHREFDYLKEGVRYLKENEANIKFDVTAVIAEVHNHGHIAQANQMAQGHAIQVKPMTHAHGGGCPGSQERVIQREAAPSFTMAGSQPSELRQWPVQMHLINPMAPYFRNADVVVAADCVAFSLGDFHSKWLKGKGLAIACPKLDSNQDIYINKIRAMIDEANINTLTVMIMQVPCCGGLLQTVKQAAAQAIRKVPIKAVVVSVEGAILSENWV